MIPFLNSKKAGNAAVSRSAPLCGGRKPNSVPARFAQDPAGEGHSSLTFPPAVTAKAATRATDTRDGSNFFNQAGDPASLFGLAPHGVYRAPKVAPRAVGFYPAFSPVPRDLKKHQRGGLFSVTLSINPGLRQRLSAAFLRHGAFRCSDFPLPSKQERPSTQLLTYPGTAQIPSTIDRLFFPSLAGTMRCLLFLLAVLLLPLMAEDGPIKTTPDLPLAFPFHTQAGVVSVPYPVMINADTILRPGMQLYCFYIPPLPDNSAFSEDKLHSADASKAYSRDVQSTGDKDRLPADVAQAIERAHKTIWNAPNNFQLALAQYPTDYIHLVYSTTGSSHDIKDEDVTLFDGLFLGFIQGKVTVIAVQDNSRAHNAGFKAGDQILGVGTVSLTDLSSFPTAYITGKEQAKESKSKTFPLQIHSADGQNQTLKMAMPPTLEGGFLENL